MSVIRNLISSTYVAVSPIKAFNAVPRFGHTSDITSIYNDGGLDMVALTDYAQGTVFVAGFCLAAFIIWILLLLILKCFGRRVGILAGHPFEEDSYMRSTPGKHTGFRSFMLMSSLIISMCGIIFLVRGARSVTNVFDDIRDGAAGLSNVAGLIVNTTDSVIAFGDDTVALKGDIIVLLEQGVCNAMGTNNAVVTGFDEAAATVVTILTSLQDFSKDNLVELRNTFAMEFDSIYSNLYEVAGTGEKWAKPMFIALPVVAFGLILAVGAFLAWRGPNIRAYFAIQTWLILPLFSLMIVVIAMLMAVTGTVLVANSDVCLGGESKTPEGFLAILLEKAGLEGDAKEATDYYIVNSCAGEYTRKTDVETLLSQLNEGLEGIGELQQMLLNDPATVAATCGVDVTRIAEVGLILDKSFVAFAEFVSITSKTADVLQCERINDIFVDFYHDALCTNSPYSFMWIFGTMMAVYGLGMLIILFRGAMLPTIRFHDARGDEGYMSNDKAMSEDEYPDDNLDRDVYEGETDEASNMHENDDKFAENTTAYNADTGGEQYMQGYNFDDDEKMEMVYDPDHENDGISHITDDDHFVENPEK